MGSPACRAALQRLRGLANSATSTLFKCSSPNRGCRYPASHRRLAAQTGSGSPTRRYSQPITLQAAAVTAALYLKSSSALLTGRQSVTTPPALRASGRTGQARAASRFLPSGHVSSNGCPEIPDHPGVTVGLDDVMALQPGLVDDMRPGGSRPPPAWEVTLPPVRGRLAERPSPCRSRAVQRPRVPESDGGPGRLQRRVGGRQADRKALLKYK